VRYPGLDTDPMHEIAKKQLKRGFGGMVVFGIKGGKKSAIKFLENLKIFHHVSNVGDTKSIATHPASTTHGQMTKEELQKVELSEELIRLSVGIEHINDLILDIEEALKKKLNIMKKLAFMIFKT